MFKLFYTILLLCLFTVSYCFSQNNDASSDHVESEKLDSIKVLIDAYRSGSNGSERNVEQMLKWLSKAAELEDPAALFELGTHYLNGFIVEQDISKGVNLVEKSEQLGLSEASLFLGKINLFGYYHQPVDSTKAEVFLEKAARRKNVEANSILGIYFLKKNKPDYEKAYEYILAAAENNDATAQYYVGYMYKNGMHVGRDFEKAAYWFTKSAHQGNAQALYSLGYLFYKGLGIEQDYQKAAHFFNLSAEKDNPNGLLMLGLCYKEGHGVPKSEAVASFFLNRSKEIHDSFQVNSVLNNGIENHQRIANNQFNGERINVREDISKFYSEKTYKEIEKNNNLFELNGNWHGKAFVYDWGGTKILEEITINISLTESSDHLFTGTFKMNDSLETTLEAKMFGNELVFSKGSFLRKEWHTETKINYLLKNATFSKLSLGAEKEILLANLHIESTDLGEPGYPHFLVLMMDELRDNPLENNVSIYPNPVTSHINIDISNEIDEEMEISIFDLNGKKVSTLFSNHLSKGMHKLEYGMSLKQGVYILNISGQNTTFSDKILVIQ